MRTDVPDGQLQGADPTSPQAIETDFSKGSPNCLVQRTTPRGDRVRRARHAPRGRSPQDSGSNRQVFHCCPPPLLCWVRHTTWVCGVSLGGSFVGRHESVNCGASNSWGSLGASPQWQRETEVGGVGADLAEVSGLTNGRLKAWQKWAHNQQRLHEIAVS